MTMIINILGLVLIGFIVWWFWLSKPRIQAAQAKGIIEIQVKEGVYQPAYIEAPLLQPIVLRFIRQDASPCAESVVFTSLNISKALPLRQPVDIQLKLEQPGEYEFTCQMGMYRGRIIVR